MEPSANATLSASPTSSTSAYSTLPGSINDLFALFMAFGALREWLKMILLGGALETCRRSASTLWASIVNSFFLTAYFEDSDPLFDFMLTWLGRQDAWKHVREIQIRSKGSDYSTDQLDELQLEDAQHADDNETLHKNKRSVKFLPVYGVTTILYFRGCRMTVLRERRDLQDGSSIESLTIRMMTRSRATLHELLVEARKAHLEESKHRVTVYVQDKYNNWRPVQSRPKRPLSSVILPDDVKYMVLDDAREFLSSEEWYSERGVPFRRGYLLHGAPGSGKTSLINAIAGELGLDIYVVTLSKKDMDDATLNELISDMPSKAIALMEDIDAAFTHDVQRTTSTSSDSNSTGAGANSGGVTLGGLLNAIDGVAAQEGRILFATTNHVERLDPALSRPGRMDLHIEFALASRWQAEKLFTSFYPVATSPDTQSEEHETHDDSSETDPLLRVQQAVKFSNTTGQLSIKARMPRLTQKTLDEYATRFAEAMPEGEFSMAQLQGHLMGYKTRPSSAVDEFPAFVQREREAVAKRALAKAEQVSGKSTPVVVVAASED
ncbi:P-loop containing nucleoside triphosphate hydrolase protein [Auriculariales sp. MPI-PUGE-AT-0066]|nr:P-loop containing nucleoside triphosphate hydrolase protein [Auriculariales sp. MPI-PUGE-AT-0066]